MFKSSTNQLYKPSFPKTLFIAYVLKLSCKRKLKTACSSTYKYCRISNVQVLPKVFSESLKMSSKSPRKVFVDIGNCIC